MSESVIKQNFKIGKTDFTVEYACNDEKDFLEKASFYAELPDTCGMEDCGSSDLMPLVRRTKENYVYYEIKCKTCGATLKFGIYQTNNKLFIKNWEPPYVAEDSGYEEPAPPKRKPASRQQVKARPKPKAQVEEEIIEEPIEEEVGYTSALEKARAKLDKRRR